MNSSRSPNTCSQMREDRVGVRVIDEARGQRGVQQRLDARRRRGRIEQREAQLVHHLLVGHVGELEQLAETREAHRRMPGRLDRREVPARALHVEDLDGLAERVLRLRLHARVAAAVQDERRIGAEQSRGVRAQREELAHSIRALFHRARGIGVDEPALHEAGS
jgi:hypothetical protein